MELGGGQFLHGDCLELMRDLPSGSVDMVLCDLPYGTTACSWDSVIPFEPLWEQYWRVCKPNAAIVLTASQPFSTTLIASQIEKFRYSWVWEKEQGVNFLSAKLMPMKVHEDVCVFYTDLGQQRGAAPEYAPLREYLQSERKLTGKSAKEIADILGNAMSSHYFTNGVQFSIPSKDNYEKLQSTGRFQMPFEQLVERYKSLGASIKPVTYNPQMTEGKPYVSGKGDSGEVTGSVTKTQTTNEGTRYPRSVLQFKRETGIHPTQKPVALFEYLIRTYTNEGETVLDNTAGSGTTAIAAENCGRRWICMERDPDYYAAAVGRVYDHCAG